ncbi:hypothetical protein GOBAR_AA15981 [Gossypium barbadense]|uniref:Uncharacterized protein n=1 Tax=Gossypium barbadense TaxID=3634 RepID=A0A2P5XMY7_GOSBA|nr:hypothetical protein GOBAR_AA15981 [Gossypium barbadense]
MVREVGLAMRCRGAQRCQHMKSPHELDERVVVAEPVSPRAVGGHHQEHPRRPPPRDIWPIRMRDDSWAAVLRSPKCHASQDGERTDALERLGLYEAVLGAKVCQHFEGEKCMWLLRACSSFSSRNSFVYKPRAAPNSGTHSWQINPPMQNWIIPGLSYLIITIWRWNVEHSSIVSSSRCSGPQLRAGPKVFGTVLPGALGETVGEGDRFSQLGPWKRTLPSSSLKQVR